MGFAFAGGKANDRLASQAGRKRRSVRTFIISAKTNTREIIVCMLKKKLVLKSLLMSVTLCPSVLSRNEFNHQKSSIVIYVCTTV